MPLYFIQDIVKISNNMGSPVLLVITKTQIKYWPFSKLNTPYHYYYQTIPYWMNGRMKYNLKRLRNNKMLLFHLIYGGHLGTLKIRYQYNFAYISILGLNYIQ